MRKRICFNHTLLTPEQIEEVKKRWEELVRGTEYTIEYGELVNNDQTLYTITNPITEKVNGCKKRI